MERAAPAGVIYYDPDAEAGAAAEIGGRVAWVRQKRTAHKGDRPPAERVDGNCRWVLAWRREEWDSILRRWWFTVWYLRDTDLVQAWQEAPRARWPVEAKPWQAVREAAAKWEPRGRTQRAGYQKNDGSESMPVRRRRRAGDG